MFDLRSGYNGRRKCSRIDRNDDWKLQPSASTTSAAVALIQQPIEQGLRWRLRLRSMLHQKLQRMVSRHLVINHQNPNDYYSSNVGSFEAHKHKVSYANNTSRPRAVFIIASTARITLKL